MGEIPALCIYRRSVLIAQPVGCVRRPALTACAVLGWFWAYLVALTKSALYHDLPGFTCRIHPRFLTMGYHEWQSTGDNDIYSA